MSDINWDDTKFDFAIRFRYNKTNDLMNFLLEKPELINGFYIAIDSNSCNRLYNSLFWTLCERPKKEDVEIIHKNNTCDMSFYNHETISVVLTQGEMEQIMTGAKVYPSVIDISVEKVWQKPPELKPTYTKAMHEAGELPPVGVIVSYAYNKDFLVSDFCKDWVDGDELEVVAHSGGFTSKINDIAVFRHNDGINMSLICKLYKPLPIKTDEEVAYEDFMENRHVLGTTEPLFHAGSKFAQSKNAENIKRAYDNGKKKGYEDKESLILKNLLEEYAITGNDIYDLIVSKILKLEINN